MCCGGVWHWSKECQRNGSVACVWLAVAVKIQWTNNITMVNSRIFLILCASCRDEWESNFTMNKIGTWIWIDPSNFCSYWTGCYNHWLAFLQPKKLKLLLIYGHNIRKFSWIILTLVSCWGLEFDMLFVPYLPETSVLHEHSFTHVNGHVTGFSLLKHGVSW